MMTEIEMTLHDCGCWFHVTLVGWDHRRGRGCRSGHESDLAGLRRELFEQIGVLV